MTAGLAGSTVTDDDEVEDGRFSRAGSEEVNRYGVLPPLIWKVKGTPPYSVAGFGWTCSNPPVVPADAPPPPQLARRTAVIKPRTMAAQVVRNVWKVTIRFPFLSVPAGRDF